MKALLPVILALSFAVGLVAAESSWRLEAGVATNAWIVKHAGQTVLTYVFNPRQCKPYISEFAPLGGRNILRDAPSDHLHHHGLMYAIKINGLNFWEEVSGNGIERVVTTTASKSGGAAILEQTIHWVAPQDAFLADTTPAALLVERRTLTLRADDANRELALEWQAQFEVGRKTNEVTLAGASYHGLGMRFQKELDELAQHSYAGLQPDLANSRQEVSPTKWAAVSFAGPDLPATIALVTHPANARGEGRMFAMRKAFPYLSATQGLDQEPLAYHTGDKFALRYLLLLYPEIKTTELLEAHAAKWRGASP